MLTCFSQANLATNGPTWPANPSVFLTHLYICFLQWRGIQEANLGPIRSTPTVAALYGRGSTFLPRNLQPPPQAFSCCLGGGENHVFLEGKRTRQDLVRALECLLCLLVFCVRRPVLFSLFW